MLILWNMPRFAKTSAGELLKMTLPTLMNPVKGVISVDINALLGRCMGSFKMVERVLSVFRESGLSDLAQLQSAIEIRDFKSTVEILHRFKGAASNVSATRLFGLLGAAEQFGHEKDTAQLTATLAEIEIEWAGYLRFTQVFAPSANAIQPGG